MKKFSAVFALFCIMFFFAACGGSKKEETTKNDNDISEISDSDGDFDSGITDITDEDPTSDQDEDSDTNAVIVDDDTADNDITGGDDDNDTPDNDTPEISEVTENHKISGYYQIGKDVSGIEAALYECGKTEKIVSANTDSNGKYSFNADISAEKSYCVKANGFASCFKGNERPHGKHFGNYECSPSI